MSTEHIKVGLRIRPLLPNELSDDNIISIENVITKLGNHNQYYQ